jgi:hypothetical protein
MKNILRAIERMKDMDGEAERWRKLSIILMMLKERALNERMFVVSHTMVNSGWLLQEASRHFVGANAWKPKRMFAFQWNF